ncbi:MAG: iron-containing alcohol dehydrogenase [Candidatus Ornithospirochaeta sp.]|nr:iron-containing alcohol dehydrogenase [Candidatus Ornithospirochaeta sp.]
MNIAKKAYSRIFQTAMRIAIPFLPYRRPVILDSVDDVSTVLKKNGVRRVLIVTDRNIRKNGLTAPLEKSLDESNIAFTVYDGTMPNPTSGNIAEALDGYRTSGAEALIGFGGGSSIDAAKAVGACIARPGKKLERMSGILRIRRRIPLLFAIPTTAGTGSETTLASIVTDSETRHKYPINDFPLIPRYAVLDPELTVSLPPSLTASTGLDALTHAIEAYIGRSTTKETRQEARTAVRLIFSNLCAAYRDGSDIEARRNMLEAAFRAGRAFTISYVGYIHAVAHSLGGKYDIQHGKANAVLLPKVLEFYGDSCTRKLAELASEVGIEGSEKERAEAFISRIREMNRMMGIPECFPELREEDINELARYADKEANPLYPVPILMDAKELGKLYRLVLGNEG